MVDWIQTRSNKKLTLRELKAEQVGDIYEIAHSLSLAFRFNRQLERPYSVAEHCVRGSRLLPAAFAGAFLLHELSEVYLPDIPAPLKPFLSVNVTRPIGNEGDAILARLPWSELEQHHTKVMLQALGLSSLEPLVYSPEVRNMDLAMLAAEKRDLVGPEPEPWELTVEPPSGLTKIDPWASSRAAQEFVTRFHELCR